MDTILNLKSKNKIFAFIFARKGSKGLKNKNIKKIKNKSLFEYSLDFAKKLRPEDVIVSSNIDKLRNYCKKNKIFYVRRPHKFARDNSPELKAWKHAILNYEKNSGKKIDIFVSLPVVSPIKNIQYLKSAIKIMNSNKYDAIISVIRSEAIPNFNLFKKGKNKIKLFKEIKKTYRRQSNYYYFIVPNFYIAKRDYVISTKHVFNGKIFPFEIRKEYSIDKNDEFDFKISKLLIENNK